MKTIRKLNRDAMRADVDSLPDDVEVNVFDGYTMINAGKRIGIAVAKATTVLWNGIWLASFAIIFAMTQSAEFAQALAPKGEQTFLATMYVEGNTTTGQLYFKNLLDQFGFDTKKSRDQSDYVVSVRLLAYHVSLCRDNTREVDVKVFVKLHDQAGRPLKDMTTKTRSRILSCDQVKYQEGLTEFVRDIVLGNELYYRAQLLDDPYE